MAKQPIYVKIMSDIENQIKDETLKSGDQIPTEKNYVNFITHLA